MLDALPRLPVGCSGSWRYSKNQTAIFAPLTRVNTPHHQANGFDQARDLDRAGPSKPMGGFACDRTDIDRSNSVTNHGRCNCANGRNWHQVPDLDVRTTVASLIGRLRSSTFRLSTAAVSMSLRGLALLFGIGTKALVWGLFSQEV